MKKLIYSLIIYLAFLFKLNANDKQISFITTSAASYSESRVSALNIAHSQVLKIVSCSTTKTGSTWVTVLKISSR